jgi:hypothetical protein
VGVGGSERYSLLLAFFLMLNTRTGLLQQRSQLERLNRAQWRSGKPPCSTISKFAHPLLAGNSFRQTSQSHLAGGGHDCTMYAVTLCVGATSDFGAYRTCEGMPGSAWLRAAR